MSVILDRTDKRLINRLERGVPLSSRPYREAAEELDGDGSARKAAVAKLFVRDHLAERRLRGISGDRTVLELFGPVTRHERLEPKALAAV